MKVFWLCNVPISSICEAEGLNKNSGGGWLTGISNMLLAKPDIKLFVCFPSNKKQCKGKIGNLQYLSFNSKESKTLFSDILKEFNPDIVHIFGTEFKHTFDMVNACENHGILDNTIIHIQGLVSFIAKHYTAGLNNKVLYGRSFRDLVRNTSIRKEQKNFEKSGKFEIEAIKKSKHIGVRTGWDYACTKLINPNAEHHFYNETLRDSFYQNEWNADTCVKHSIFISQCSYPIKGFHFMLKAMKYIVKQYPDAHIYTTGPNILNGTFKEKLKLSYYKIYLKKLIQKYKLQNNITFLGMLSEQQMTESFLKANVFVSPSTIENSPNSVGEAMLLGVPTVSSNVGGVKDMLEHGEEGFLYQSDAPYMLAYYVMMLFEDKDLQIKFSKNARAHAQKTHNKEINNKTLLDIYEAIKK